MTGINTSQLGQPAGEEAAAAGGDDFIQNLMKIKGKIEQNPKLKRQVAYLVEQQGMDPEMLGLELEQEPEPQEVEAVEDAGRPDHADAGRPDHAEPEPARIEADEFIELIGEFKQQVGGKYTIDQVHAYAQSDPDTIQDMLDEHVNDVEDEGEDDE